MGTLKISAVLFLLLGSNSPAAGEVSSDCRVRLLHALKRELNDHIHPEMLEIYSGAKPELCDQTLKRCKKEPCRFNKTEYRRTCNSRWALLQMIQVVQKPSTLEEVIEDLARSKGVDCRLEKQPKKMRSPEELETRLMGLLQKGDLEAFEKWKLELVKFLTSNPGHAQYKEYRAVGERLEAAKRKQEEQAEMCPDHLGRKVPCEEPKKRQEQFKEEPAEKIRKDGSGGRLSAPSVSEGDASGSRSTGVRCEASRITTLRAQCSKCKKPNCAPCQLLQACTPKRLDQKSLDQIFDNIGQ